jgi:transposase
VAATPIELPRTLEEAHALILKLLPLVAKVEQLQARVEELERRLNQSSRNSSLPPSSDPPRVKLPPKQKPSGRKPGGQPGHEGSTRTRLPPEKLAGSSDHFPDACDACGQRFSAADRRGEPDDPRWHQVTDIPPIVPRTVEYRLHALRCGCGAVTRAPLPDGVPAGAFGPSLDALVATASGSYRLSKRTIVGLVADWFGIDIALGSIIACERRISDMLAEPYAEAHRFVQAQATAHADETGWCQARKKAWLWVVTTTFVTVFLIHRLRGRVAAHALLGTFAGTLGTDRWVAYDDYKGRRQLCWSHLARDFQALSEYRGKMGRIGRELLRLKRRTFRYWKRVRDGTLTRGELQRKMKPVRRKVAYLLEEGVRCPVARASGMCWEIYERIDHLWTFVDVKGVEPTNNAAERAIRPGVLWRKGSFGTHSEEGSRFVERMMTVTATLRQQRRNVVEYIRQVSHARLHNLPAPSLLPHANVVPTLAIAA